jgi:hypothetical protein
MSVEVTDWVHVPPDRKLASTGLGYVVDAETLNEDRSIATARVHFIGWSGEGNVWSTGNLERVSPEEELGILFAAYLRSLIDDELLSELLRAWRRTCEIGARSPGLLTRLWERCPPGVASFLGELKVGPWVRELAAWVPRLDPAPPANSAALAVDPAPAVDPDAGPEPEPELEPEVEEELGPPPDESERAGWPELTLDTVGDTDQTKCLVLRSGESATHLLVENKHGRRGPLLARHVYGSVVVACFVDLAWSGRTLRGSGRTQAKIEAALAAALAGLGVQATATLGRREGVRWLRGIRLIRGSGIPGPPPLQPVSRFRPVVPTAGLVHEPTVPRSIATALGLPGETCLTRARTVARLMQTALA